MSFHGWYQPGLVGVCFPLKESLISHGLLKLQKKIKNSIHILHKIFSNVQWYIMGVIGLIIGRARHNRSRNPIIGLSDPNALLGRRGRFHGISRPIMAGETDYRTDLLTGSVGLAHNRRHRAHNRPHRPFWEMSDLAKRWEFRRLGTSGVVYRVYMW